MDAYHVGFGMLRQSLCFCNHLRLPTLPSSHDLRARDGILGPMRISEGGFLHESSYLGYEGLLPAEDGPVDYPMDGGEDGDDDDGDSSRDDADDEDGDDADRRMRRRRALSSGRLRYYCTYC
ncbi:hypothetical protein Tco_0010011 [Tanacetum coccineum]